MIFASAIVTVMGVLWLWTERLDRKEQRRELWPQSFAWRIVPGAPFDYEREPNL